MELVKCNTILDAFPTASSSSRIRYKAREYTVGPSRHAGRPSLKSDSLPGSNSDLASLLYRPPYHSTRTATLCRFGQSRYLKKYAIAGKKTPSQPAVPRQAHIRTIRPDAKETTRASTSPRAQAGSNCPWSLTQVFGWSAREKVCLYSKCQSSSTR